MTKNYRKRLETAPWRYRVRDSLANGKYEQALAVVDGELSTVPPQKGGNDTNSHETNMDWTDLMLYRAMALGFLKRNEEALAVLDKLRNDQNIETAARYKAASMKVELFMSQKQWQSALDEIMRLEGTLDQPHSHWSETIAQARSELKMAADHAAASTQPDQSQEPASVHP